MRTGFQFACVMFIVFAFSSGGSVQADNWPHWRGESGNGVSTTATPLTEWSDTKNVKWKVVLPGLGSSTPIVWQDRVYVTCGKSLEEGSPELPRMRFLVSCYDRNSGALVWEQTAIEARPHEQTHQTNGFASASPCTDGKQIYVSFGSRGIYCYSMEGELKWKKSLGQMQTRNMFGEGSSPTLAGDKLIVPWDHEGQSYLYALDKQTGDILWQTSRDEPTCWATPLVIEHKGRRQIIMNGQNYARAYDLQTGTELWRCGGQTQRPVASPVHAEGIVYIGSGFRGSFLGAFLPDGTGDIAGTTNVLWTKQKDTPDIASLLLSQDRLYYYKEKTGLLTCVNATTGEPYYATQRIGLSSIYASPIAAGGHVYLTDRDGTTVVIEDAPELKIVATNSVGETVDATPVPVDKQLFIRGQKHLFCIAK
ncbi:MAG: PQQ-binding-like beta-propeller repeat protein [Planctomycetaceae bacterium]|nr:PQQ-like beta-propeller repeat protein [Planctomycetaceae bacterium]